MYRNARPAPRNGFRLSERHASGVDNGPSDHQREQQQAYRDRIEAERQRYKRRHGQGKEASQ